MWTAITDTTVQRPKRAGKQRLASATGISLAALFASVIISCAPSPDVPNPTRTALPRADEFAWRLFMDVSRQALPDKAGQADPSCASIKTYSEDCCVVWESWALSTRDAELDSEVFPKGDLVLWSKLVRPEKEHRFAALGPKDDVCEANVFPMDSKTDSKWRAALVEVRVNEPAYTHIQNKKLNLRKKVSDLFDANTYADDPVRVDFPPHSQFAKARWKQITEKDKPRYHWRMVGGKPHGLIALHVVSKEDPNWFWCTFIHESEAPGGSTHPDLVGTKWAHYYLVGTQSEFTDAHGLPTRLRNPVIEINYRHVSCITCHAYARVNPDGGEPTALPPNSEPIPESGAPNWKHFWEKVTPDGVPPRYKMRCVPTDFVWSIPKNAH